MVQPTSFPKARKPAKVRSHNLSYLVAILSDTIASEIKQLYPNLDVVRMELLDDKFSRPLREYLDKTLTDLGLIAPAEENEDDGA